MEKHMETEIAAINQQSFKDKIKSYTKHPGSFLLLLLVLVAAVLTVGVLVFLVGYILIRGIPYDGGDTFRYSFYYLWTLWYVVFRDSIKMGLLNDGRCSDACNHGTPGHHENDGGSTFMCAGFIP